MLNEFRIQNFKRYIDQSIDLRPKVVVLVGPNSSGKSSLIKSILAFKQTYEDQRDHSGFLSKGAYVDIGPYNEYVYNHQIKKKSTFSFSIEKPKSRTRIHGLHFGACTLKITQEESPQTGHGRLYEYSLFFPPNAQENSISVNSRDLDIHIKFTRMQKSEEAYRITISRKLYELIVKDFANSRDDIPSYEKIEKILSSGKIQAIRSNEGGMIPTLGSNKPFGAMNFLFNFLYFSLQDIHRLFYDDVTDGTFALAALRDEPQRSSPRTDEKLVVGARGENTTSVFMDFRQRAIKSGKNHTKTSEDFNRLENWVKRLKLTNSIEVSSWRDLVDLRVKMRRGHNSDSIADIGVGFSQAFPVLLQLAVMPNETRIILEQPELHLYPWAQKELGEILCDEAKRGNKQLIIETHSEHVIRGIQTHVSRARVEGKQSVLTNDEVSILYISQEGDVKNLKLNEYGEFEESWPPGFFDQGLDAIDEILRNKTRPSFIN